jgi:hypothetical protein
LTYVVARPAEQVQPMYFRSTFAPVNDMTKASGGMTDAERIEHYLKQAAQFREWATTETNEEARAGLLDMARQYDRLTTAVAAKADRPANPSTST